MKNKRFRVYSDRRKDSNTMKKLDVLNSPDAKTDQDYPGFPNGQSTLAMITPVTNTEKVLAAVDIKDGDKMTDDEKANAQTMAADEKK